MALSKISYSNDICELRCDIYFILLEEKPNPLSSKKKNPHQKLSVIEEYDAASSDATSTHQLSTDEQRVNLTIEASHKKLSSTSTQEVTSASEEVKASSSSDEDAEEVWEDAREEPESNSDEGKFCVIERGT